MMVRIVGRWRQPDIRNRSLVGYKTDTPSSRYRRIDGMELCVIYPTLTWNLLHCDVVGNNLSAVFTCQICQPLLHLHYQSFGTRLRNTLVTK